MIYRVKKEKMKTILFLLSSFIALTSLISGLFMISDPNGDVLSLSTTLLSGTPFKTFLIPGILLTLVVGIPNLLAVFYNMQRHAMRYKWATAGGVAVCGWILVQLILLNTLYWLHFLYFAIGVMIILVSYQLKGKWAV